MGGKSETLAGLSGIGDLMLTCYSPLSRNNRFGLSIGNGKNIEDSIKEIGEVVEGYPTLKHIQNIISNYDGNPYTTIDEIKKKLILHLISPIKWREILNNLEVNKIYELGGNNLKKNLELNNIDIEKYNYIG